MSLVIYLRDAVTSKWRGQRLSNTCGLDVEEKMKECTRLNINSLSHLCPRWQLESKKPCLWSVQVGQYSFTLYDNQRRALPKAIFGIFLSL